jgi:hypothetical protein
LGNVVGVGAGAEDGGNARGLQGRHVLVGNDAASYQIS